MINEIIDPGKDETIYRKRKIYIFYLIKNEKEDGTQRKDCQFVSHIFFYIFLESHYEYDKSNDSEMHYPQYREDTKEDSPPSEGESNNKKQQYTKIESDLEDRFPVLVLR